MRYLLPLLLLATTPALADPRTDCPTPTPCKVLTINADEEKALMGDRMVFDTAVAARQLDMLPIAAYFKNKLQAAPAGDAPKPPEAPSAPPPATGNAPAK